MGRRIGGRVLSMLSLSRSAQSRSKNHSSMIRGHNGPRGRAAGDKDEAAGLKASLSTASVVVEVQCYLSDEDSEGRSSRRSSSSSGHGSHSSWTSSTSKNAPTTDNLSTHTRLSVSEPAGAYAAVDPQQLFSAEVGTKYAAVPAVCTGSGGASVHAAVDSSSGSGSSSYAAHGSSLEAAAAALPPPTGASAGVTAVAFIEQQGVSTVQLQDAATPAADNAASSLKWSFGSSCCQNGRSHMEDRILTLDLTGHAAFPGAQRAVMCAVFDGHGGQDTAEYLACNMARHVLAEGPAALQQKPGSVLERAVQAAEGEVLAAWAPGSGHASGSTLCLALLVDEAMHVAHVGDSRAVLARGGRAVSLTEDHKASTPAEAQRISTVHPGAHVSSDGYLYGELGVSRGIGSAHVKCSPGRHAFVAQPDISSLHLDSSDDCVILATDGVWDTVSPADAVAAVRRSLAVCKDAAAAAGALVERAVRLGSQDNVSAVVLLLHGRDIVLPKSNSRLFSRRTMEVPQQQAAPAVDGCVA